MEMFDQGARPLPSTQSLFSLARWRAELRRRAGYLNPDEDARILVIGAGLATFVFGLLLGALLNLYLVAADDPMVHQLRMILSYRSAILGDGLVLPVVNMAATSYLVRQRRHVGKSFILAALLLGAAVTGYLHVMQAANGLVNWAMPTPWHWNSVGVLHALYMLAVVSWLLLFLLVVLKVAERPTAMPREAGIVLVGVIVFLFLLRLDYRSAELQWAPSADEFRGDFGGLARGSPLEALGVAAR